MGNFQKGGDSRGGSRGGFEKRRFTGARRGDNTSQMHKATCVECSKSCEVPFRPTGEKPVFCRDCFGAKKGANSKYESRDNSRSFSNENRDGNRDDSAIEEIKNQLYVMNAKIETLSNIIASLTSKEENIDEENFGDKILKKFIAKKVTKKVVVKKK